MIRQAKTARIRISPDRAMQNSRRSMRKNHHSARPPPAALQPLLAPCR
ncbi:hypothetical protein RR42_s1097 [Cupriavidus basilensis]|uniref:Uncharacterized protein n=1 Tax=Cupriavidus basilensis TaxID=68895 RepID=A0A0C4YQ32_9BURK|nr:hypothetical protein RR42_s1097 [Cupriavidus basilensis]